MVQAGGPGSNMDFECKEVSAAAVHRQLVEVYENDVMNGQSMQNSVHTLEPNESVRTM